MNRTIRICTALLLAFASAHVLAAPIYITNYPSDANAKVFVTKYKSEANCIVYETAYRSENDPGV
jgi:hypothetical protein